MEGFSASTPSRRRNLKNARTAESFVAMEDFFSCFSKRASEKAANAQGVYRSKINGDIGAARPK